jgi:peptide/nickel transport system permease protein
MHAYFAKRVLLFIPTLIIVSFAAFFIVNILPGDPALFLLVGGEPGGEGGVDPVEYEKLRRELGTDRPFLIQYADWSWGVLR